MVYLIYNEPGEDRFDLIICDNIGSWDDETIELNRVYFKAILMEPSDKNGNKDYTGISGGEDFFIFTPDEPIEDWKIETFKSWTDTFEIKMEEVLEKLTPEKCRQGLKEIFEGDPLGNGLE